MIEIQSGKIKIDDVDIASLPRETIRRMLNVIPQDTFFLHGSVRLNLDFSGKTDDNALITALERVKLWDVITVNGGLDAELKPELLSHGQRQLFCLARSILREGKIVLLDEITSK